MANPKLRQALEKGEFVVAPGAADALTARMMQVLGFPALCIPGSGTGFVVNVPEPLLTWNDMANVAETVVKGVHDDLPVIVDAHHGWGSPVRVMHAMRILEDAGASAAHIEDQTFPPSVNYLGGVEELVPVDEWQQRLEYALKARRSRDFLIIGRTDIYRDTIGGTREDAVKRAHAAIEVGVDAIMVQVSRNVDDLHYFRKHIPDIPLCVGASPGKYEIPELKAAGWQIILHPLIPYTAAGMAIYRAFKHIQDTGYVRESDEADRREFWKLKEEFADMAEKVSVEAATSKTPVVAKGQLAEELREFAHQAAVQEKKKR